MSHSWTYQTLGEACQIKPPKKEAKERLARTDSVSFVPMNDLGIREKRFAPMEEKPFEKVSGSYTYFADGDVLLAKITPCFENGKLGIARGLTNGIGFGSSEFIVFRPKDYLDPEFLFYCLSQDSFRDSGQKVMSGAVGHKRVPKEFIENYEIPLPPFAEQKRIVAILDEAFAGIDAAIANTEKNLANARELFDSYLSSVEAERKPLGSYVTIKTGKLNANAAVEHGLYPFFTCSREASKIDNYAFDCEAILLAGNNASGDFNVKHYSGKFNAYQRTYVIEIKDEKQLSYRFLYYQLIKSLKELKNSSIGVGTKYLKLGMIKDLEVSVPDIGRQIQIANVLDELDAETYRLVNNCKNRLSALSELKQALLKKAFSGELTAETAEKEADEAVA